MSQFSLFICTFRELSFCLAHIIVSASATLVQVCVGTTMAGGSDHHCRPVHRRGHGPLSCMNIFHAVLANKCLGIRLGLLLCDRVHARADEAVHMVMPAAKASSTKAMPKGHRTWVTSAAPPAPFIRPPGSWVVCSLPPTPIPLRPAPELRHLRIFRLSKIPAELQCSGKTRCCICARSL